MASPAPGAVDAALELMRRLPPEAVVENLTALLSAAPELTEELLSRVDQPLQVATDGVTGREFLLCDYNRDADAYRRAARLRARAAARAVRFSMAVFRFAFGARACGGAAERACACVCRSPWSNEYFPALEDGAKPPEALRVRGAARPSLRVRNSESADDACAVPPLRRVRRPPARSLPPPRAAAATSRAPSAAPRHASALLPNSARATTLGGVSVPTRTAHASF
jgi:hypothetical protein